LARLDLCQGFVLQALVLDFNWGLLLNHLNLGKGGRLLIISPSRMLLFHWDSRVLGEEVAFLGEHIVFSRKNQHTTGHVLLHLHIDGIVLREFVVALSLGISGFRRG